MSRFSSDFEPEFFTSVIEERKWVYWMAIILAAVIASCGGMMGFSRWSIVAVAVGSHLVFSKILRLCISRQKSNETRASIACEKPQVETLWLIESWKKILGEDPPLSWVLFSNGTCVLFDEPVLNPLSESKKILKKWGPYDAGASSGDMLVITLKDHLGFIVGGHHPSIFTLVNPTVGLGEKTGACLPGLIGRYHRELDANTLEIIHSKE